MVRLTPLAQSSKLQNVQYEIRGPAQQEAMRMEAAGDEVLKLNIGNPAPFGLGAPDALVQEVIANLHRAEGYSDSKGVLSARQAVVDRYAAVDGFPELSVDDVFLGNGVSELITMTMQALLDDGDEVLIPAPDYPLWTAMTGLAGGTPVHYLCDEANGWQPDIADIEAKVTERTKAIVVINPNNPTGAVYSAEMLEQLAELARRHSLLLLADEIYDRILFDGAQHTSLATLAPDLLTITYNGLSKTYRAAGFRSGWMVLSGPKDHAAGLIQGLNLLASTRLCPNVPAQFGIKAALEGHQSIEDLIGPGGRLLEQRNTAVSELEAIPGISVVQPKGALYVFPRIDPNVHEIPDDEQFVLELLRAERILVTQGTGFNWPTPDHFRIVTLPWQRDLREGIQRIGSFLAGYRP